MIIKKVSNSFLKDEEIEIKKTYFNAIEQMKLFQKLYFLYDRSNIIKRTFINEIKKFLPFYCSGSFYGEMEKEKDILGNRKNCQIIFH